MLVIIVDVAVEIGAEHTEEGGHLYSAPAVHIVGLSIKGTGLHSVIFMLLNKNISCWQRALCIWSIISFHLPDYSLR